MGAIIDYAQIEDDVKNNLIDSGKIPSDVDIVTTPDSEAEYKKAFNSKITVLYVGSKYRDNEGGGFIVQREEVQIALLFESKKTRGAKGVYQAMANAREVTIGFQPTFCGKMFLKEQTPIEKDGIFYFHQIYSCYSMLQESLPDSVEPGLNEITFTRN